MIVQVEKILSENDCRSLMEMYDRHAHLTDIKDYTGHPVLYWMHVQNAPGAKKIFQHLIDECARHISRHLKFPVPVFPETAILATMGTGGHHPQHADNAVQDEDGHWIPNHTPIRDVSAIYYLNGEFEGGELVFEQHGITIKPRRGLLVIFPSDQEHIHEVLPVRSGRRYTATLWFTKQKASALVEFENLETAMTRPRHFSAVRRLLTMGS